MIEMMTEKSGSHSRERHPELSILYVATFPPRKCGIATFTQEVVHAMDEMLAPAITSKVLALNPNDISSYQYPRKVIFQLNQDDDQEYVKIARIV